VEYAIVRLENSKTVEDICNRSESKLAIDSTDLTILNNRFKAINTVLSSLSKLSTDTTADIKKIEYAIELLEDVQTHDKKTTKDQTNETGGNDQGGAAETFKDKDKTSRGNGKEDKDGRKEGNVGENVEDNFEHTKDINPTTVAKPNPLEDKKGATRNGAGGKPAGGKDDITGSQDEAPVNKPLRKSRGIPQYVVSPASGSLTIADLRILRSDIRTHAAPMVSDMVRSQAGTKGPMASAGFRPAVEARQPSDPKQVFSVNLDILEHNLQLPVGHAKRVNLRTLAVESPYHISNLSDRLSPSNLERGGPLDENQESPSGRGQTSGSPSSFNSDNGE